MVMPVPTQAIDVIDIGCTGER